MDDVVNRVGPIDGLIVRRPGQAVGKNGVTLHHLQLGRNVAVNRAPCIQTIQLGQTCCAWLVHGARPESAQAVAFAVVEADSCRVVADGCNFLQLPPPVRGAIKPVAQGHHQPAAPGWRDAAGLLRQVPTLHRASARLGATNLLARNVDPIQHLLLRMPKRRFAQQIRGGGDTLPIC